MEDNEYFRLYLSDPLVISTPSTPVTEQTATTEDLDYFKGYL